MKKQRARGLEDVRAMSCTEDSIKLWMADFARTVHEHGITSPSQVTMSIIATKFKGRLVRRAERSVTFATINF